MKNEIIKILSLDNIDCGDTDLISSTIAQKNIHVDFVKAEEIFNNSSNITLNTEEVIDNNSNINIYNKNEIESKIKEEKKEEFNENEMEHKTVDEIYNYINDNNDNKIKKKKRNKKKKNKNNEKNKQIKIMNEENKIRDYNDDDEIINNFKQDIIDNMVDANEVNKIKPFVSENFLKIISEKY